MPGKLVGAIDMYDKYTFVEVPREYGKEVLEAMKNAKIKGRSVNMEPANQKYKRNKKPRVRMIFRISLTRDFFVMLLSDHCPILLTILRLIFIKKNAVAHTDTSSAIGNAHHTRLTLPDCANRYAAGSRITNCLAMDMHIL